MREEVQIPIVHTSCALWREKDERGDAEKMKKI
jgi:hypothetical protein